MFESSFVVFFCTFIVVPLLLLQCIYFVLCFGFDAYNLGLVKKAQKESQKMRQTVVYVNEMCTR